jgi:hypothetical protein
LKPTQATETEAFTYLYKGMWESRIQPDMTLKHPNFCIQTVREKNVNKLTIAVLVFASCLLASSAHGQQFDAAFGVSTITSSSGTITNGLYFPSDTGGTYPGFSADLLLRHRIGFEGDISWRASQNLYGGIGSQPYRPIFYSFNAIWAPKLTKNLTAELLAGIGGEDVRFYGVVNCSNFFGCTNYASSNHFMGDFGGGIRAYIWHDVFVRPEVRLYLINNNLEFSSNTVVRYGGSLGYSFGGR